MSAIEVLNIWVSKPVIFDESFMTKDEYVEQVNLKVAVKEVLERLKSNELIEIKIVDNSLGKSTYALELAKQINKIIKQKGELIYGYKI